MRFTSAEPKTVTVIIAGTNNTKTRKQRISVHPNTKVGFALEQLQLPGYALGKDGKVFSSSDDLYEVVQDGDVIYAAMNDVEAGATRCSCGCGVFVAESSGE